MGFGSSILDGRGNLDLGNLVSIAGFGRGFTNFMVETLLWSPE